MTTEETLDLFERSIAWQLGEVMDCVNDKRRNKGRLLELSGRRQQLMREWFAWTASERITREVDAIIAGRKRK